MIIKKYQYYCDKCREAQLFEVDKPFSTKCPMCNEEMKYVLTGNFDTELAEQRKTLRMLP